MFGYIGEQGLVESVTLSGVSSISTPFCGGIAGLNEGKVQYCSVDTATVSRAQTAAANAVQRNTSFFMQTSLWQDALPHGV